MTVANPLQNACTTTWLYLVITLPKHNVNPCLIGHADFPLITSGYVRSQN